MLCGWKKKVEKVRRLRRCPRDSLFAMPDNSANSVCPILCPHSLKIRSSYVYTDYADPRRTEWIVKIQPALKKAELKTLVRLCKNTLSRREIIERRAGRSKPRRKTQELLIAILTKLVAI